MKSPYFFVLILCLALVFPVLAVAPTEYAYGTATASSEYSATYAASKAFDNDPGSNWNAVGGYPSWVKMNYGAGVTHVINNYTMSASSTSHPHAWTFEGSNDDSSWTTLDTRTGQNFVMGTVYDYICANTVAYRYYKIAMSSGDGDGVLYEVELLFDSVSDTTPPDSITGLANGTPACDQIPWSWTNPAGSKNADYYQLVTWKNGVWYANLTNSTSTTTWSTLSEHTAYVFSSKTEDLSHNLNATFVNATATTAWCAPAPTPTPTTTTTGAAAAAAVREVTTTPERRIIPWWDNDKAPVYLGLIAIALIVLFRRR